MSATHYRVTTFCFLSIVIIGCASTPTAKSALPTPFSTPTIKVNHTSPTTSIVQTITPESKLTQTPINLTKPLPTASVAPTITVNLPTQSPSPTLTQGFSNELLPLKGLVLTETDLRESETQGLDYYLPMFAFQSDATQELGTGCLLDCVKRVYGGGYTSLTIILLRAGSPEKALRTSENLRLSFLTEKAYEYTPDSLRRLPADIWLISSGIINRSLVFGIGTTHGSTVVFMVFRQGFCGIVEGNLYCEGDGSYFAEIAIQFISLQIQKLTKAGYLP